MVPFDLPSSIQRYVAVSSIGSSTVRSRPSGTLDAARGFLETIRLGRMGIKKGWEFRERPDRLTEDLRISLPARAKYWGLARKILNMFLRDATYNHYLRNEFNLDRAETRLEIPLDSAVATGLRRRSPRGSLPPWPGLRGLKPADHAVFQQRASELAAEYGMDRVHLDTVLWIEER